MFYSEKEHIISSSEMKIALSSVPCLWERIVTRKYEKNIKSNREYTGNIV